MSDYGKELLEKIEAASQMETKSRTLEYFRIFLHDHIGGTPPPELVTAKTPKYSLYKCRQSFFLNIARYANELLSQSIVSDPATVKRIEKFLAFYRDVIANKAYTNRVTEDDIKIADDFLTYMINELSK